MNYSHVVGDAIKYVSLLGLTGINSLEFKIDLLLNRNSFYQILENMKRDNKKKRMSGVGFKPTLLFENHSLNLLYFIYLLSSDILIENIK